MTTGKEIWKKTSKCTKEELYAEILTVPPNVFVHLLIIDPALILYEFEKGAFQKIDLIECVEAAAHVTETTIRQRADVKMIGVAIVA